MARRPRKIGMISMSPSDYEDALDRSGLVFRPTVHHPSMMLAVVQHLVCKRGVFGADEFQQGMGKFFPDGFTWSHFRKQMQMFDGHGVDPRHTRVFIGFFLSLCMFLRMLLGTDGAVRFLLAMIEAAMGTVEFDFDKGGEPVVSYKITEDGTQERDAWDSEFGLYDLWASEVMQRCVNPRELQSYLVYASTTGASEEIRKVADATIDFTFQVRRDGALAGQSYGGIADAVSGVTLLGQLRRDAEHLFRRPFAPVQAYAPYGGGSIYNEAAVRQWGDAQRAYLKSTLGGPPRWPVEGQTVERLTALVEEQKFGFTRPVPGQAPHVHTGVDLAAGKGTPCLAIYPGRVVKVGSGWKDDRSNPDWSKGNYVVLDYSGEDVPGGAVFRHSYYHLDSVEKLKVGDEVYQGQRIGAIGTTGNSTGPHLHLETAWMRRGGMLPLDVKALDPALVLRDGAISAARSSGVQLVAMGGEAPRPVLGLASAAIHALVSGGHLVSATGMPLVDPSLMVRAAQAAQGGAAQGGAAGGAAQGGVTDVLSDIGKKINQVGEKIGDYIYKDLFADGSAGRTALQATFLTFGIPPQVTTAALNGLAAANDALHKGGGKVDNSAAISAFTSAFTSAGVSEAAAAQLAKQAAALGGYVES